MFETKAHPMFRALITRNGKPAFWTPMFSGAEKSAQNYLELHEDAAECSLYKGPRQRFVKTVKRKSDK